MLGRIAPPEYVWTFKCGERDLLFGKIMLCERCKWLEPNERPEQCENKVTIDLRPKY